ncbi:hypothetical protein EMIT0P294_20359 [Pseudomonas sp. IT-P294]
MPHLIPSPTSYLNKMPLTRVSPCFVAHVMYIADSNKYVCKDDLSLGKFFKLLECVLLIASIDLSREKIDSPEFMKIMNLLIGALASKKFAGWTNRHRYSVTEQCKVLIQLIYDHHRLDHKLPDIGFYLNSEDLNALVNNFEKLSIRPEVKLYLNGWKCRNAKGKTVSIELYELYASHGAEFTIGIYNVCQSYLATRASCYIYAIRPLINLLTNEYKDSTALELNDPDFTERLFSDMRKKYFLENHDENSPTRFRTLCKHWRGPISFFLENKLFPSGLIAKPRRGLPTNTPPKHLAETHMGKNEDGKNISSKLTFDVPLEVTDDEAIELIFGQVSKDITTITSWAKYSIARHYKTFDTALKHGQIGSITPVANIVKKVDSMAELSPQQIQYVVHKFREFGYQTYPDSLAGTQHFRVPLTAAAEILGLPNREILTAYAAYLIVVHPEVTPSFLSTLELYDVHGRYSGYIEVDNVVYLKGYKRRKGKKKAEQIVFLTPETNDAVKKLIEMARPLREFLRRNGDDNWRLLFLSRGRLFSYPSPVKFEMGSQYRSTLEKELIESTNISSNYARTLAKRITLTAIRATSAIKLYIEDRDLAGVSKRLGHDEFSIKLLKRYVPSALIRFFAVRWIRIVQHLIIFEAVSDTDYLSPATGMTIDQANQFIKNHVVNFRKHFNTECENAGSIQANDNDTEIIISVGISSLRLLLDFSNRDLNRENNDSTDSYWIRISRLLIDHIGDENFNRPDIKAMLASARLITPVVST